jgi:hypothetical protein
MAAEKKFAFQHRGADRAEQHRENPQALDQYWLDAKVMLVDTHGNACFLENTEEPVFVDALSVFPQRHDAPVFWVWRRIRPGSR